MSTAKFLNSGDVNNSDKLAADQALSRDVLKLDNRDLKYVEKFLDGSVIESKPTLLSDIVKATYFNIALKDTEGTKLTQNLLNPISKIESEYLNGRYINLPLIDLYFNEDFSSLSEAEKREKLEEYVASLSVEVSDNSLDIEMRERSIEELQKKIEKWSKAHKKVLENSNLTSADVELWQALEKKNKKSRNSFLQRSQKIIDIASEQILVLKREIEELKANKSSGYINANEALQDYVLSLFDRSIEWVILARKHAVIECEVVSDKNDTLILQFTAYLDISTLGKKLYISKLLNWHGYEFPDSLDIPAEFFWISSYIYPIILGSVFNRIDPDVDLMSFVFNGVNKPLKGLAEIEKKRILEEESKKYPTNYANKLLSCISCKLHGKSIKYSPTGDSFLPISWQTSLVHPSQKGTLLTPSRQKIELSYKKQSKSSGGIYNPNEEESIIYHELSNVSVHKGELSYTALLHFPTAKNMRFNTLLKEEKTGALTVWEYENIQQLYIGDVYLLKSEGSNTGLIFAGSIIFKWSPAKKDKAGFWGMFALVNQKLSPMLQTYLEKLGIRHRQFIKYPTEAKISIYWSALIGTLYPYYLQKNHLKIEGNRFQNVNGMIAIEFLCSNGYQIILPDNRGDIRVARNKTKGRLKDI